MPLTLQEQLHREAERRISRNVRDRLAREYIRKYPNIKIDPNGPISFDEIPEGTTEAAIRGIAKYYYKQKLIRDILRERKNDDTRREQEKETAE
tara:strand:+ start:4920 stop:5201 length:282 start_codon:yes stop_codon:yes gene_type:complete